MLENDNNVEKARTHLSKRLQYETTKESFCLKNDNRDERQLRQKCKL